MSGNSKTCDSTELIQVLEQLPEGVLVVDGDGVVLFANKAGARLVKLKPKKAVGSTFAHAVEDGPMKDFDVEMTVKEVTWGEAPAKLLHLKSLKSSGAFHLEWKLESALDRARTAEEALANLQAQSPSGNGKPAVDTSYYEERISELEQLLELAEQRADEMQGEIALEDHQQATALQDALREARAAEDQIRRLEDELEENRERVRVAEEQAEVAEERAYSLELELEQLVAAKEEVEEARSELVTEVEDLRTAVSTWRHSVDRLTAEVDASETVQAELREKLATTEEKLATTEEKLAEAGAKLAETGANLAEAEGKLAETEEKLAETEEKLAETEEKLAEAGEKLAEAEEASKAGEELVAINERLAETEAERDALRQEVEDMRHEKTLALEESDELAEQLRLEMEQFEERTQCLEAERDEAKGRVAEIQSERDSLKEQLDSLARSKEGDANEKTELLAKVAELEAAGRECDALKKDVRRLENLLQNAEELAQKGERVEKLERKLEGALRRAEEAEERLLEERSLLNEMKARSNKAPEAVPASVSEMSPAGGTETQRLAFQDELTGLPNKNILHRYLGFMLKQSTRHNRLTAMLRIDCENFKTIFDTFGQNVGDQLIRAVGERLSSVVRGTDVLGRYGEHEFVILLSELTDQDEATVMTASVIKRLQQKMSKPFIAGDQTVRIDASVGVSIYPLDAHNGEQMFEHSSVALRRAKEVGRGQGQYFTPELQTRHEARNELDHQLKIGLENDQFEVLYQPIFDLTNGQVIGVESLIRWNHPQHGVLEPDNFLQVAEDSGMIVLIGNWALQQALERAAEWQRHGLGMFVSINLSKRQLLQADLVPTIDSIMAEFGCSPDRVLLEIPEKLTSSDVTRVRETLLELSRIGVRLAVDNFGTGFTSLQDLRRGPFQVLKVDRRFVKGVPINEENTSIVLSALTLSHHLGRISIAVGVESDTERVWLAKTGCRFAQGNFLSEPLTPDQVPAYVKRG